MNVGDDGMTHLAVAAHDWCGQHSITSPAISNSVCGSFDPTARWLASAARTVQEHFAGR